MPGKILAADDDAEILRLYGKLFSAKGYHCSLADSVAAASALIRENDFDLLVTDLMFPDGLGTELANRFAEKFAGLEAILVTGSPPDPDALAAWPVRACLSKPVDTDKLMAMVEKALA